MQNQVKTSGHQQIKRYFLIAIVALLSLSAMLGIGMILFGSFSWEVVKVIGTTVALGVSALLMSGNVARLNERSLVRVSMWMALVANFLATLYVILGIWGAFRNSCDGAEYASACMRNWRSFMEITLKVFLICLNMAFSLSIIGRFLTYRAQRSEVMAVCYATIVVAVILAMIFAIMTLFGIETDEVTLKIIVILCILLVFGLIATPILMALERNRDKKIVESNMVSSGVDEQVLRAQIEQEVRAKIAAEQMEKQEEDK